MIARAPLGAPWSYRGEPERGKTMKYNPLTPDLAYAIGQDAANAQMRRANRTKWNVEDWNKACEVTNLLLDLLAHQEQMAGVPLDQQTYQ